MKTILREWKQVCLVVTMLLMAGTVLAGEEVVRNGVLHIINESSPSGGTEIITLEEVWRVGGEEGDDFFGLVTQVVVADDGSIFLLDTQLSEVPVYAPDGERLGTLSHEGEGPGETRMPTNMVLMPNGNLGLVQRFPGKLTLIDQQGTPMGEVEPELPEGGFVVLFDCFPRADGQMIVIGQNLKQNGTTGRTELSFVSNFSSDGIETVRLLEIVKEVDFSNFHFREDDENKISFRKTAVGTDDRVYVSKSRNIYEIHVYQPDGQLDRIIKRKYEHRVRTDEQYQKIYNVVEAQLSRVPGARFDISKTEPDIQSLRMAADGNLWVTSSWSGYEEPEGVLVTYDVFDPDGHFIKQVAVSCEGDGENDIMYCSPDGTAILVTGFVEAMRSLQSGGTASDDDGEEEPAPMEIIYLRTI